MKRGHLIGAFSIPGSRRIRLVLSIIFIALATAFIMTIYEVGLVVLFPKITVWQSIITDVTFTTIMAPLVALYILLRFEGLYGRISKEIEERKRAEEELEAAKKQAELYLDLMGHDINNLNQIALGYLELADGMVKDEEVKMFIKKPVDAIANSSKLIDNVRKLQKVKTDGLNIEAIDIDSILIELRGRYLNVPDKDVIIDYTPGRGCLVMANGLLKDVFSNLIENAIKHSGPSKPVWIGVGLERYKEGEREYCKVAVEDNGPGISDEQKDKVFERFHKANAKTGGKGLGLYLVRSLVEDFQGTVRVEDRVPGDNTKGSRFVVILPAVEK